MFTLIISYADTGVILMLITRVTTIIINNQDILTDIRSLYHCDI